MNNLYSIAFPTPAGRLFGFAAERNYKTHRREAAIPSPLNPLNPLNLVNPLNHHARQGVSMSPLNPKKGRKAAFSFLWYNISDYMPVILREALINS